MSNRFHNKFHKRNHDTDPTVGDIDSATDPIASAAEPFKGDFNLDGDLVVGTGQKVTTPTVEADSVEATNVSTEGLESGTGTITLGSDLNASGYFILNYPLANMSDVIITAPSDGQVLTYNSGSWINAGVAVVDESITFAKFDPNVWGDGITTNVDKVEADFATSGDMATGTSETVVVSPARLADAGLVKNIEVVGVSSSTSGSLVVGGGGSRTYDIDGFTYAGGVTIPWADVIEVEVYLTASNPNGWTIYCYATIPGDTTPTNMEKIWHSYTSGNNGNAYQYNELPISVKVGKNQQFIRFSNNTSITTTIKRVRYVERYGA
jgi:hypothetical protein